MDFTPMKALMDRLTAWRIPGNSISVCLGNEEVFRYQSGFENLETGTRLTPEHLFNIYSCSKVATVTAGLQLYEKGFFLLDDPVYEFIPEYRDLVVQNRDGSVEKAKVPMTMRHLFTMTSGLDYNCSGEVFRKARELTGGKMETLAVAKCLASRPLSFEPGAHWQYSLSHDVLAAVIEVISGKKFRDYMQEKLFAPLDMQETVYHNEAVLDRVAVQYRYENSEEQDLVKLQSEGRQQPVGRAVRVEKTVQHVFGPEYDSGGAGITTSVSDYSKFVSALANGGVGQTGERILSKSTIELLRTNQLNEVQLGDFGWPQLKGYGYGLGVRTLMDRAKSGSTGNIGEFGWGGAAGATVLVDPDMGLSMFYAHHMLNPQEEYYQPRLRNVLYTCLNS